MEKRGGGMYGDAWASATASAAATAGIEAARSGTE
jgi:hypothetical protein